MACQDVVEVDLEDGVRQVVVDAWLTNEFGPQTIKLRRTSPYFDATPSPAITGATISVTNQAGTVFNFFDENNSGNYVWESDAFENLGNVGDVYQLDIAIDGVNYQSFSAMNRVPVVDSIVVTFEEEELGSPEGFYGEFFAKDFEGAGDAYWIKAFKNGQFLNKPGEMNIAFDASFTAGNGVDGTAFIAPIRDNINRFPDTGDDAVDDFEVPPYVEGDSIRVEIHSINLDAFFYLVQLRTQMTLGDAALFAEPPANVSTNILTLDSDRTEDQAVGFFNVAAMTSLEKRVE
jgi:hypothetical protein